MFLISMVHCVSLNVMLCMLFLHLELVSKFCLGHFSSDVTLVGITQCFTTKIKIGHIFSVLEYGIKN
jgi:hypothetical protein